VPKVVLDQRLAPACVLEISRLGVPHTSPQPVPEPHPDARAPEPVEFPEEELMPESKLHLVLRFFLFRLLRFALGPGHRVGSE
jgi:hypothetical protein